MTTSPNTPFHKKPWTAFLRMPITIVLVGTAYPGAAHSQKPVPAQTLLTKHHHVVSQPVDRKAQATPKLRSLTHPFPPVTPQSDSVIFTPYNRVIGFSQPSFPVASGGKSVWYSTGANQIYCSLLLPNSTWLGTGFGLKRLDNRTKTTRHFCALDGLPYNRITALAGQEKQLYCSAEEITPNDPRRSPSETDPHHSAVALCRYHADSGKWEKVAEETRNYPQGTHLNPPEASKAITQYAGSFSDHAEQQYITVGDDRACLVMGPGMPGQGLALISPTKRGKPEKILCPGFAKEPFHVSFAHADRESLWIGSDLGLLRYDFKAHRWERLLSDLVVNGGCPAEQGALWLLTRRFDAVHPDKDGYKAQTEHWQITHFVPGKNPENFALIDHENRESQSGDTTLFANIVAAGDRIWITEQRFLGWGDMGRTYYPAVYSLNLQTRQVTLEVPSASDDKRYQSVPDTLLANALTGFHSLTPLTMPERFPGWICPPDENRRPHPEREVAYALSGAEDADGRWFTQGQSGSGGPEGSYSRQVLKHVDSRGAERESFTFPAFTVEAHEPVSSPAILGGKVYFLSDVASLRLYSWDRKTNRVTPVPEMDATLLQQKTDLRGRCRLLSDGESLWIGIGRDVLHYTLKTKQIAVWSGDKKQADSWGTPYSLLSVEAGKAWIKGAPNRLFTVSDPTSTQMVPVTLPPFPADAEQDPAGATLVAMEAGIVWFQTKSAAIPRHPILIGYRTQSHTWTPPYQGALSLMSAADTTPIVKQGPIQWLYGASSVFGFNTETGQWQTLPPIPDEMQAYWATLASVDAQNAWVLSESKLLHLDRARNTWSSEEVPFQRSSLQLPTGIREENSLLVPTHLGLWTIDLTTKRTQQAPAIRSFGVLNYFHVVAVDHNAIWVVGGRTGEGFLLRFDRGTHTWINLPAQAGVSVTQYDGTQWRADEKSCWLNTPTDTYRLDLKTQHWENVSARLASGQQRLSFQQVIPDGENVWLVPAGVDAHNLPLVQPLAVPLYRYNIKADRFVPVQPSPGTPLLPRLLTVNPNSVLLATAEGNFRLDRATNRWRPLPSPALPPGFPPLIAYAIYEEPGNYWFAGKDSSLHLKK